MCQVCVDYLKGAMNYQEALRALGELTTANKDNYSEKQHFMEVAEKILENENLSNDSRETD